MIGEVISDQQALRAYIAMRNNGELGEEVKNKIANSAGEMDKSHQVIAATNDFKVEQGKNTLEFAQMENMKPLNDAFGDLSQKLSLYAKEYPSLTQFLVGAKDAVVAFGSALAGVSVLNLLSSGGTGGMLKGAGGLVKGAGNLAKSAGGMLKNAGSFVRAGMGSVAGAGAGAVGSLGAVASRASKAVPVVGAVVTGVQAASVLMDDEATKKEKGEAIGSAAGATAGAIAGQMLIPIPVVGAVIGSLVGNWLGKSAGGSIADLWSDDNDAKPKVHAPYQDENEYGYIQQKYGVSTTNQSMSAQNMSAYSGLTDIRPNWAEAQQVNGSADSVVQLGQVLTESLSRALSGRENVIQNQISLQIDGRTVAESVADFHYKEMASNCVKSPVFSRLCRSIFLHKTSWIPFFACSN